MSKRKEQERIKNKNHILYIDYLKYDIIHFRP